MPDTPYHIPALLPQCIEALDVKPDGTYIDVTYGGGGHSRAITSLLDSGKGGHLYAFDQDMDAVSRAMADERFTIVHGNFRFITNFMRYYGVDSVDGILADLGVSFHHFDDSERGFSFRFDGPLDMRMNQRAPLTAARLLAEASEGRLSDIFYLYGELRQAGALARTIISRRTSGQPLATCQDLIDTVAPYINRRKEKKELAQVFQALRIEVNDEMQALRQMLQGALKLLRPGGRLAIITYHSLEDRLVKNFFRTGNFEGILDKDIYGRTNAPLKPLGSKPIVPDQAEIDANPRSRSAKLRVAQKL